MGDDDRGIERAEQPDVHTGASDATKPDAKPAAARFKLSPRMVDVTLEELGKTVAFVGADSFRKA